MTIKRCFLAAAMLALTITTTGCFEQLSGPYEGPPQLEFKPTAQSVPNRPADRRAWGDTAVTFFWR